jgi:hypothetical protein
MAIRIFVVFHKRIDDQILAHFTPAETEAWFVRFAVNERHPKAVRDRDGTWHDVPPEGRPGVITEYRLPRRFPELQDRGFMETSCYVHVEANGLHDGMDWIGVCQYDMWWTPEATNLLRALERTDPDRRRAFGIPVGPLVLPDGRAHPLAFADRRNWRFLLDHYNAFFGTRWGREALVGQPLTLYQTYLLPREHFVELARWLAKLCADVYPWATEAPYETHWGSLSGYTERAEALFLAIRLHERRLSFAALPLHHDEGVSTALGIEKTHYAPS